jgi:hypothetical protein
MEIVDVKNIELIVGEGRARAERQHRRSQQTETKGFRHPVLLIFRRQRLPLAVPPIPLSRVTRRAGCFHLTCATASEKLGQCPRFPSGGKQKSSREGELFIFGNR